MIRKRADNNNKIIKDVLLSGGLSLTNTGNVGGGFSDWVGGFNKINYLIEVKNAEWRWKLTPAQKKFHAEWKGEIFILETADQAVDWINTLRAVR